MERYFIQKEIDCESCDGRGKVYHQRSCAEDDRSGYYQCIICRGTGKTQEMYDVTTEVNRNKQAYEVLKNLTSCNDCDSRKTCPYAPKWGASVRYNCYMWKGKNGNETN